MDDAREQIPPEPPQRPNSDRDERVRQMLVTNIWFVVAFGIPLLILGFRGDWGHLFKSGEAAAFMCGALVGAFAENILEQYSDKFTKFKKSLVLGISFYLPGLALFVWNLYFSVHDTTLHNPGWIGCNFLPSSTPLVQLLSYDFCIPNIHHIRLWP